MLDHHVFQRYKLKSHVLQPQNVINSSIVVNRSEKKNRHSLMLIYYTACLNVMKYTAFLRNNATNSFIFKLLQLNDESTQVHVLAFVITDQ